MILVPSCQIVFSTRENEYENKKKHTSYGIMEPDILQPSRDTLRYPFFKK